MAGKKKKVLQAREGPIRVDDINMPLELIINVNIH